MVTGKPVEIGGSRGRQSATGLGVVYVLQQALETQDKDISQSTVAIQGFGNVGSHVGIESHAMGAKIVAVSDVQGGIYNPNGINISELFRYLKQGTAGIRSGCFMSLCFRIGYSGKKHGKCKSKNYCRGSQWACHTRGF